MDDVVFNRSKHTSPLCFFASDFLSIMLREWLSRHSNMVNLLVYEPKFLGGLVRRCLPITHPHS